MGRKPWPLMADQFNERIRRFGGPSAHDETGVGEVMHDLIDTSTTGFDFRHRVERDKMLNDYIVSVERGDQLLYPMIEYAFTEHLHATVDDLFGSGHLPDSVAAGALAWWAKEYAPGSYDSDAWRPYQR